MQCQAPWTFHALYINHYETLWPTKYIKLVFFNFLPLTNNKTFLNWVSLIVFFLTWKYSATPTCYRNFIIVDKKDLNINAWISLSLLLTQIYPIRIKEKLINLVQIQNFACLLKTYILLIIVKRLTRAYIAWNSE